MGLEQMLLSIIGQAGQQFGKPAIGASSAGSEVTSFGKRAGQFSQTAGPLIQMLMQLQESKRSGLAELGLFRGLTSGLGGGGGGRLG